MDIWVKKYGNFCTGNTGGDKANYERVAYNSHGRDGGEVEIQALGERGTFTRVPKRGGTRGEVCINDRYVYTMQHNPLKEGHTRKEAYIDSERRMGRVFREMFSAVCGDLCFITYSEISKFKSFIICYIVWQMGL